VWAWSRCSIDHEASVETENGGFAVAVEKLHGDFEAVQTGEHFARHWAGHDVPANDDLIDACCTDFAQYGFERRQVAVDVVERRYPHIGLLPPQSSV
jgi:hypothetical protein